MLRVFQAMPFAQAVTFTAKSVLAFVVLAGIITAGIITVYLHKREDAEDLEPVSDDDLLEQFERARFAGEMDEEEFQRVCAVLKNKKAAQAVAQSQPAPASQADPSPVDPRAELPPEGPSEPAPGEPA
jgi:LytS/YehU family sensor histidine kinase